MHHLQLNLPVFAFWLFLALAISAMSTAVLSHNLLLDGAAILVSILTVVAPNADMTIRNNNYTYPVKG